MILIIGIPFVTLVCFVGRLICWLNVTEVLFFPVKLSTIEVGAIACAVQLFNCTCS